MATILDGLGFGGCPPGLITWTELKQKLEQGKNCNRKDMGWARLGVLGSLPYGPSCQQPSWQPRCQGPAWVPASWPPHSPPSGWPPPGSSAGHCRPPAGLAPPVPASQPAWLTCGHRPKVTTAQPIEGHAWKPQGGWRDPWTLRVLLRPRLASGGSRLSYRSVEQKVHSLPG